MNSTSFVLKRVSVRTKSISFVLKLVSFVPTPIKFVTKLISVGSSLVSVGSSLVENVTKLVDVEMKLVEDVTKLIRFGPTACCGPQKPSPLTKNDAVVRTKNDPHREHDCYRIDFEVLF